MGALYQGQWFLRSGAANWVAYTGGAFPVAGTITANGAQPVTISVTNLDISALVGLEVWIAYGASEADLGRSGHLSRIYTVPSAVAGGATGSGSVTAPLAPIASGSYYSLVYAGNFGGIDQRRVSATFDANGALNGYVSPMADGSTPREAPVRGTAVVSELAGDDKITIGRWNNGTPSGTYYAITLPTLTADQGEHYAIGIRPATLPPDGTTKCYALTAATRPTVKEGSATTGSLAPSSRILVTFGSAGKFAIDMTTTVGATTVQYATPGGSASPVSFGTNGVTFLASSFANGFAPISYSTSTATASGPVSQVVYLFFAGTNAERVGIAYARYAGSGSSPGAIYGTAYFSESSCTHG